MSETTTGWQPIPIALKILLVLFVLWSIGALMNLPNLMENGLPLFGKFVYGLVAALIALFLDVVGPMTFGYALWNRKSWAPKWAYFYIGLFIVNSVVAFFTVREQLGIPQILIPTLVSLGFIGVIFWKRGYFVRASTG